MTRQETTYNKLSALLKKYMRDNHKRCTKERLTILRYCCEQQPPIMYSTLIDKAQDDGISTQTIYDTLDLMVEAGIMHRVASHSRQYSSFALLEERRTKAKIICTKCGRISSFKDAVLSERIRDRAYDNFTMKHYAILVYGECKICHTTKDKASWKK